MPTTASNAVVSDQPFINPSAQPTGLVVYLAEQELQAKPVETKSKKKKSSKSEKKHIKIARHDIPASASDITGPGDDTQEPIFQPVQASSSTTGQDRKSTSPSEHSSFSAAITSHTGQDKEFTGSMEQDTFPPASASNVEFTGAGSQAFQQAQEYRHPPKQDISDPEFSGDDDSNVEEGETILTSKIRLSI